MAWPVHSKRARGGTERVLSVNPMWTIAPPLFACALVLPLWARGHRGVALLLPAALALLSGVAQGHGRHPLVLSASSAIFVGAAFLGARRMLGSRMTPKQRDLARARSLALGEATYAAPGRSPAAANAGFAALERGALGETPSDWIPRVEAPTSAGEPKGPPRAWTRMLEAGAPAPVYPFAASAARGNGRTNGSSTRVGSKGGAGSLSGAGPSNGTASAAPTAAPSAAASAAASAAGPAPRIHLVRKRSLVEALEAAASDAQGPWLLPALRDPGERVRLAYDRGHSAAAFRPALGAAVRAGRGRWGTSEHPGLLVRFEGYAPGDATLLAVLVSIEEPESASEQAPTLLLVPTGLAAVKRLDPRAEPRARWVARAAFVPEHMILGETDGIGAGEAILADLA